MLDTTGLITPALTLDPRRGRTDVNVELDQLAGEVGWLTPGQFAELIAEAGILGHPDTPSSGPVGRWILDQLQAIGIPAVTYSWVGTLCVYNNALTLIGEIRIPQRHTMYELECEVNDGEHPEITWQGAADPR